VLEMQANERGLVVVGAGGFGREVADLARTLGRVVNGFLDDATPDGPKLPAPLLGPLDAWVALDADLVLAIGQPHVKARALTRLPSDGRFSPALVHPSAVVVDGASVGAGSVIAALAVVMVDTAIGEHVLINYGATIGHDARIGAWSSIMPGARISGFVRIGEEVLVGANAVVLEGITVGDRAVVGAGAVVTKDVPAGATVVGVPARSMER
jgi:sugar O-acyltransferase (sialic acid O-acetyltransferase NeuD family)